MNLHLLGGSYSQIGIIKIAHTKLIKCSLAFFETAVLSLSDSWIDNSLEFSSDKFYIGSTRDTNNIERNIFSESLPLVIGNNVHFQNNTFHNTQGIEVYGNSSIKFEYNNFLGDNFLKLFNEFSKIESATLNYWNTTDSNEISQMIYDKNDNLKLFIYRGFALQCS